MRAAGWLAGGAILAATWHGIMARLGSTLPLSSSCPCIRQTVGRAPRSKYIDSLVSITGRVPHTSPHLSLHPVSITPPTNQGPHCYDGGFITAVELKVLQLHQTAAVAAVTAQLHQRAAEVEAAQEHLYGKGVAAGACLEGGREMTGVGGEYRE